MRLADLIKDLEEVAKRHPDADVTGATGFIMATAPGGTEPIQAQPGFLLIEDHDMDVEIPLLPDGWEPY